MQMIVEGIILNLHSHTPSYCIHNAVCLGTKGEKKTMQRERLAQSQLHCLLSYKVNG